ncbi:MAG: efflux RND transporter permease subunit, partial [Candidatus Sumerlaeota bacterium]
NALQTATSLRKTLDQLQATFPAGMTYEVPYDTTPFIRIAIEEVATTFAEAIGLVTLVVLLFLGTWRATLIPLVAVPVAIVGTFTGMLLLGFSINSLTLFGLVLAIGIVVDDAILVVENVERIMHEENLPAREATIRAMEQVSGPIIAIVLVLASVFLPVGFLGGLTGELYRQFAVTIAISVLISGIVALTLSPAMCAIMLRPQQKKVFVFRWFDNAFVWFQGHYASVIRLMIRWGIVTMILFAAMIVVTIEMFKNRPSGFIPQEDQGYLIGVVMLPPGASLDRTQAVVNDIEQYMKKQPEVAHVVALVGMDLFSGFSPSTSSAVMFLPLKPWDERPGPEHHVDAIVERAKKEFGGMKEGFAFFLNPPPVQGLGFRAGIEYQLENRAGESPAGLVAQLHKLTGEMSALDEAGKPKHPQLSQPNGQFNVGLPQLYVDLDIERTKLRGVPISAVYSTLQALLGSLYINDFVKFGRIYRVQVEADAPYRKSADVIDKLYIRNTRGDMVPLSELVTTRMQAGPNIISRFNGFPSVQITADAGRDPVTNLAYSTGQAIIEMEKISKGDPEKKIPGILPQGYSYEWSGSSYQEIRAGAQAPYIIAFGLLIVFLVLCGLYERWSLPVAVMLGIPSGAFGAIIAIYLRGIPKDIYFQVGLLTLIGLAAKNAILIVEYASVLHEEGMSTVEAAVEAARVRLRPFIMTSMAFVLGVTPLVIAKGAGAGGRHSIGTGVMGGMIAATFLDMFFVPLFFVIVQWMSEWRSRWRKKRGLPPLPQHHGRKHTPIHGPGQLSGDAHAVEANGHAAHDGNGTAAKPPKPIEPTTAH